ncbi:hypothetical protein MNBD_GAMMA09-921 [hydrothermal vent metagenome]|uniref:Peptidase M14 domain-containing protein n=1 Tax=hydrothermal vent metagenome TaxID=652676 RepID=A0A3B0XMT6_9ZZZZ
MLTRISLFFILIFMLANAHGEKTLSEQQSVNAACLRISQKLSSVTLDECLSLNLGHSGALSSNKHSLLLKEYAPRPEKRTPQAKILILGGIHGDEYSSVTIMFKWMHILNRHHSGLFHWKIAPLANPDGLLQKKSQRMNANNVDLNRNFPTGTEAQSSLKYWKQHAYSDPRRYPGKTPASEIETQWIIQLIREFQPDAIVAVHAPYGIVDFDGQPDPPARLGSLYLKLLGTYPGSLGNYAGLQQNIPVITVELPYAGIMPNNADIKRIWIDLISWLKNNTPQGNIATTAFQKKKS